MSALVLIARIGPLAALLALWLQVLGGGVVPAMRAASVMVAPLCHAPDGRAKPALPGHQADCDSCVLCMVPAGGVVAQAGGMPLPGLFRIIASVGWPPSAQPPRWSDPGHGPRGPPAVLS